MNESIKYSGKMALDFCLWMNYVGSGLDRNSGPIQFMLYGYTKSG